MTRASVFLLLLSQVLSACGPNENAACDGCSGQDLIDCEETFELCKDVKGCKRRYVKKDYAEGLCTNPTAYEGCLGCTVDTWEACHEEFADCEASEQCTGEDRVALREKYALDLCASD